MKYNGQYPPPTKAERDQRQAEALELTTGARTGNPPLTERERALLQAIRALGYELTSTERYPRYISRAA